MRQTKKGESIYFASAYPKDRKRNRVSLGLVSSKSKKGALAKSRRLYGDKYRKYVVS